jgi:colanic acid/amylovoran biosynthesis glycosyltransferase
MKVGYLMNTYPVTSGTFIRREIHALEAQGWTVRRYAVRRWSEALVEPADRTEAERTRYLLQGRAAGLLRDFAAVAIADPRGALRAIGTCVRLARNAGGGARHLAYLLEAASLTRFARRDGVRHVHAHFSTNTAAVALLARRMGGPSYSFTAHGPDEFVDPAASSLALKVEGSAFVAAISHYARTRLALAAGMAHWDRIHVVRCGLALDAFPVSDRPFDGPPTLVCVGRLCVQKGQTLIPAAVERAAARRPDLKVILIGDGDTRGAIEAEIAARGLAGRVVLAGWRANAEVAEAIAGARTLLLPSFAEGLPIVIMESLALGRPVITTYIAGIPELVDSECGWIVPAGDEAGLATAIDAALDAPAEVLSRMGRVGRARIERLHDLTRSAETLGRLFAAAAADDAPDAPAPLQSAA